MGEKAPDGFMSQSDAGKSPKNGNFS